jgi:hypothetical protein
MQQPAQDGFCPEKVSSGSVHYPLITPEQRRAAIAHRKLRAKIVALACEDIPINLRSGIAVAHIEAPKPEPVFSMGQWVERQKEIHTSYKTWFVVEEDITPPPAKLRIRDIQKATASYFDVTVLDMNSERRTRNVVRPRMVAAYLCKKLTPHSLPEIGRRFGGRDHTTILHSIRKIEDLLFRETPGLADDIATIRASLGIGEQA